MNFIARSFAARHVALAAALTLSLATAPALAQSCFEDVGCPSDHNIPIWLLKQLSCDALWTVRNSIFHDNGYCFKTQRALSVWNNDGCQYWNSGQVPLNSYERTNVSRISSVEKQMGCN
jgi:hypothetical protein